MSSAFDILYGEAGVTRPAPITHYKVNRYFCDRLNETIYVARASDTLEWCRAQEYEEATRRFVINTAFFGRYDKWPGEEYKLCPGTRLFGLSEDDAESLSCDVYEVKRDKAQGWPDRSESRASSWFSRSASALEEIVRAGDGEWRGWVENHR